MARHITWKGHRVVIGATALAVGQYLYRKEPIRLDSDEPPRFHDGSEPASSTGAQSFGRPLSRLQKDKSVKSFSDVSFSNGERLRKFEESYTPSLGGISRIDIVQFAWYCTRIALFHRSFFLFTDYCRLVQFRTNGGRLCHDDSPSPIRPLVLLCVVRRSRRMGNERLPS